MAKSTRSKIKRHFRAKKREEGVYAATEAARVERLASKMAAIRGTGKEDEAVEESAERVEGAEVTDEQLESPPAAAEKMDLDGAAAPKKISTHGPRASRREEWRTSKGMTPRPKSKGMNRQGGIAAIRRSGRPQRRR